MKKIVTLLLILLFGLGFFSLLQTEHYNYSDQLTSNNEASAFLIPGRSVADLKSHYARSTGPEKIKLLIVPGHEPGFGGAEYKNLKEREMAVELAGYLNDFLNNNTRYAITLARTNTAWNPALERYFSTNWNEIKKFNNDQKEEMKRLIGLGKITRVYDGLIHNKAPTDVALRLYGINKWSNENAIDIALHIHFNDYPRKNMNKPGDYSGFTIYVPDKQYSNAATTEAIANSIFKRLEKFLPVSNFPPEDSGVVEDQDLVAIGSHNSADAASMLIEYGYIYEPQFEDEAVRHAILKEMAYQTYLGLQDFFNERKDAVLINTTTLLPSVWPLEISAAQENPLDILGLQAGLTIEGAYPPSGETKNSCPLTGHFGPCTNESVTNFQKKYSIQNEYGKAGAQTLLKLSQLLRQK